MRPQKILLSDNIENQKLIVNQKNFWTNGCEAFRAIFPGKYGEMDGAWLLGLNVVAMLVSVNMS